MGKQRSFAVKVQREDGWYEQTDHKTKRKQKTEGLGAALKFTSLEMFFIALHFGQVLYKPVTLSSISVTNRFATFDAHRLVN